MIRKMLEADERRDEAAHAMVIRLESLADEELKTLQAAFPYEEGDASNPKKDFNRRVDSECRRRQLP
jgi:hypothetical protein